MKRKFKGVGVIGLLCMSLLVGCYNNQPGQETSDEAIQKTQDKQTKENLHDTLLISMRNPKTLHPLYNMEKSIEETLHLIFDTLINIEPSGEVTPNIAKSWVLDATTNKLTLVIEEGITWHDGQKLTAEDVAFSMQTLQKIDKSPYKMAVENVSNIQVVDEKTLVISYRQSFSGIYQSLFFPVIPKHIYNVEDSHTAKNILPVGSGPYQFESIESLKSMQLIANDNYFKGKPNINHIEVMIIPDHESSLYAFEQDLIDVIYTDVMDWGKYTKDKSARIYEIPTNNYEFMGLNFNRPKFQNANIRLALIYGLDRQKMVDIYYLGNGIVADTPISPESYLYNEDYMIKAYDVEKSKFLLTQEGYTLDSTKNLFTKNNIPLSFSLLVNEGNTERVKVAEGIKEMYRQIGIDVTIEQVDESTYLNRIYSNEFDAFLGGWKLSYMMDLTFAFHSSQITGGDNFIHYKDETMDQLLQKAFQATPMQVEEAYTKLQTYFAESNPYISLYFRNGALITKSFIGGNIEPDPLNSYANIEEWTLSEEQ